MLIVSNIHYMLKLSVPSCPRHSVPLILSNYLRKFVFNYIHRLFLCPMPSSYFCRNICIKTCKLRKLPCLNKSDAFEQHCLTSRPGKVGNVAQGPSHQSCGLSASTDICRYKYSVFFFLAPPKNASTGPPLNFLSVGITFTSTDT